MSMFKPGEPFALGDFIAVKPGRTSSRQLILPDGAGASSWDLYGLDTGETISSETAPHAKWIQMLEGTLHLTVDGQLCRLTAGLSAWVPAGTWHDFAADGPCKYLQISF